LPHADPGKRLGTPFIVTVSLRTQWFLFSAEVNMRLKALLSMLFVLVATLALAKPAQYKLPTPGVV